MFNAPRPAQNRYAASSNTLAGSFVDEGNNPLAVSGYDSYDPWSGTATPPPPEQPSVFSSVIADATVPTIYHQAFAAVDPNASGEISLNSLTKVVESSSLPSTMVERIINLVSSKPRVTKMEFYVALALVALAQQDRDPSIEQVADMAKRNSLPEPRLNLGAVQSVIRLPSHPMPIGAAPAYSTEDPWTTTTRVSGLPSTSLPAVSNGVPSAIEGTGLSREWWLRQARVTVTNMGQQGFILNRYTVYQIVSERGSPVNRRYSEFVFLWDCLIKRYPFRLIIGLPPKRLGPDESFIEQRRKGLQRCLNFVVNHPVIKDDGILHSFLTEMSFESWRKTHLHISLDEESLSKRLDRTEEMSIPSDLEEKLNIVREKIQPVIEQWQRICFYAERLVKRREGAASDFSRLSVSLKALNEVNGKCWKGESCELCGGVREGLATVSRHLESAAEITEERSHTLAHSSLEVLKAQRDLYLAVRDLFLRHDRLSGDQVERLRKRIDQNSVKLETVRTAQKDGWQGEVDKYSSLIEKDQAAISTALARRIFLRYSMWQELRVVLHNRENALLSLAIQTFAREETSFEESTAEIWGSLNRMVESMPME